MSIEQTGEQLGPPYWLARLDRIAGLLVLAMAMCGGLLFFLAAIFIVVDVMGRNFGGFYSGATDEMGGYCLAIGTSWAMAYTLRRNGHIVVDVLTSKLSARWGKRLTVLAAASMIAFGGFVAWFTGKMAVFSYALGAQSNVSGTPLAIPQALMAFGFAILTLDAILSCLVAWFESSRASVGPSGKPG